MTDDEINVTIVAYNRFSKHLSVSLRASVGGRMAIATCKDERKWEIVKRGLSAEGPWPVIVMSVEPSVEVSRKKLENYAVDQSLI